MFTISKGFYSNDPKIVFDHQWRIDQNKINDLKQHTLAVLDFSSEHYGDDTLTVLYRELDKSGLNFLLLSHDINDHRRLPRLLFFPHWYHWAVKHFRDGAPIEVSERSFKWSCLNGNPRPHRIYNYVYSSNQSYFHQSTFSMFNRDIPTRGDDIELNQETLSQWNKLRTALPLEQEKVDGPIWGDHSLPAISDAYIHLVTETTIGQKIFVSEKMWKPIAWGQLFLVFGNPGTINYLRSQGVDVFDDIIDHSYDSELDSTIRHYKIHEQLKRLLDLNLRDLYINTYQRRKVNAEKFFSGEFDKQYYREIQECINMQS